MTVPPIIPTISGLPAVGRIDPMSDQGMHNQLDFIRNQLTAEARANVATITAANALITHTPESEQTATGKVTHALGNGFIGQIGGVVQAAAAALAGKTVLSINGTDRATQLARTNTANQNVRSI